MCSVVVELHPDIFFQCGDFIFSLKAEGVFSFSNILIGQFIYFILYCIDITVHRIEFSNTSYFFLKYFIKWSSLVLKLLHFGYMCSLSLRSIGVVVSPFTWTYITKIVFNWVMSEQVIIGADLGRFIKYIWSLRDLSDSFLPKSSSGYRLTASKQNISTLCNVFIDKYIFLSIFLLHLISQVRIGISNSRRPLVASHIHKLSNLFVRDLSLLLNRVKISISVWSCPGRKEFFSSRDFGKLDMISKVLLDFKVECDKTLANDVFVRIFSLIISRHISNVDLDCVDSFFSGLFVRGSPISSGVSCPDPSVSSNSLCRKVVSECLGFKNTSYRYYVILDIKTVACFETVYFYLPLIFFLDVSALQIILQVVYNEIVSRIRNVMVRYVDIFSLDIDFSRYTSLEIIFQEMLLLNSYSNILKNNYSLDLRLVFPLNFHSIFHLWISELFPSLVDLHPLPVFRRPYRHDFLYLIEQHIHEFVEVKFAGLQKYKFVLHILRSFLSLFLCFNPFPCISQHSLVMRCPRCCRLSCLVNPPYFDDCYTLQSEIDIQFNFFKVLQFFRDTIHIQSGFIVTSKLGVEIINNRLKNTEIKDPKIKNAKVCKYVTGKSNE